MEKALNNNSKLWTLFSWIFLFLFFSIGVLNLVLVHPVPGIIYILFSLIYFPPFSEYMKAKFRFTPPIMLKVILAILVLWFTLAVGDLMEMFEAWMGV